MAKDGGWFGQRHVIATFAFFAVTIGYAQRVNLSIAIVAMTDRNTTLDSDTEYFPWDEGIRSAILSSFFWGYVVTQIPAGQLAERFGPKIVLAVGVGLCSLFTLVSPLAANGGWEWLCACRVFQGLGQAVLYPSIHALLARWCPPCERGRISTFTYTGAQIGTVVALATGGILAATRGLGWPSIFYIFGGLGLLWSVVWLIFGSSGPDEHRWISDWESQYILSALDSQKENSAPKELKTPWKSILTSIPVLAILMAHGGQNWGYWTLLTQLPTYMANVLNYNIKHNGLLSALPYVAMSIFSLVISWLSDQALGRKWLSIAAARKLANSIGHWGPAIALIILGYIPINQPLAALGLLILAVGLNGAAFVGYQVNHIDLSPNFAGTLMGITNCIANLMSIVAPLVAGELAPDSSNADQWRMVFFVTAAIYFVLNLIFVIFGKGEVQSWNQPSSANKGHSNKVGPSSTETENETVFVVRL
ncbi:putative inorganic phosphate cotransporter [Ischnura elegans]|uniref:putative inorganic phosphate cotransporter n=1 Tax=Ischnura elegans TaxID=197161 RepID=UPI001ED8958F|nr:putative inorganic phosphate cotransporter [Ischnura elegans]